MDFYYPVGLRVLDFFRAGSRRFCRAQSAAQHQRQRVAKSRFLPPVRFHVAAQLLPDRFRKGLFLLLSCPGSLAKWRKGELRKSQIRISIADEAIYNVCGRKVCPCAGREVHRTAITACVLCFFCLHAVLECLEVRRQEYFSSHHNIHGKARHDL